MLGHSPRPLKSYPGEDALALPPLQLGPEDREELRLREADDARGQHHALVHRHPAREQRLERREHLLERRRGEEAEPAEVHAEEGYPQIANRARHGEEGPVAAEHDEQVHLRRQLRLAHGRDARRRDQPGGLLLQDRGEPPRLEPLEEFLDRGPRGASTPNTDGRIFSNEMNETSMTASVGCSPKIRGSSARALVFSITTTRGSLRSLTSSWPVPTSTAYTRAAPRCSRQSVKPPVEAPTSRQTRPATFIWKASSAWTSFSPPRPTNGVRPWTSTLASLATRAPALSTRLPSTSTSPARRRRAACSRLSTSPRSTSTRSIRTRATGLVTPFIIGDRP